MKLWGGRFSKAQDALTDDFNSSIRFDARMYKQDIEGSIAHAGMLGKQGIIPVEDATLIQATLAEILKDIEAGKVEFLIDAEDIHMNVEKLLIDRIGDVGKRLHTGRRILHGQNRPPFTQGITAVFQIFQRGINAVNRHRFQAGGKFRIRAACQYEGIFIQHGHVQQFSGRGPLIGGSKRAFVHDFLPKDPHRRGITFQPHQVDLIIASIQSQPAARFA